MPVKKGDKIKVEYEGKFEDGKVFDTSNHEGHSHPIEFEVGSGQVVKGFDDGVIGMEKDEEKEIDIKPEEGYGQYNPQLIKKLPKEQFPTDKELKEGMLLAINLPDGKQIPAKIIKVDENEITIDLNHPLAGKVLKFKIKIVEVA